MSNGLLVSGLGAAVGYVVGGPTGAQFGWMLGSMASAKKTQSLAPNKLADLEIQTSQYGVGVNRICGTQRVPGNIIWYGDKRQYTHSSGGGGGKGSSNSSPKTYTQGYTVDFAIGICEGPILGVRKVWADGTLIIDCTSAANPLIGELYLGSDTQGQDPTMVAAQGADNVPAYRGLAYIVMNDFDLGPSGRIPTFSFEVVKTEPL